MSSVRKRNLPSGKIRWLCDYKDQAGKRRAKQFHTKQKAEDYETKVRSEIVNGVHVPDRASTTVADAAQIWIDQGSLDALQAATCEMRKLHCNKHIIPRIGAVRLTQLSTPRCVQFKNQLLGELDRGYARAIHTSFKSLLSEAQRRGLIATNPATEVKIINRRAEDEEDDEVVIPTKDQIRSILEKAALLWPLVRVQITRKRESKIVPIPWQPLLITAIFTGMRQGELRGLAWRHVDLEQGIIKVRQRADKWCNLGPVKTRTSRRNITMAPIVAKTLKEWKLASGPSQQDALVFPNEKGRPIQQTNIGTTAFYPLMIACGIAKVDGRYPINFKSLRHFAASLFIEQGWSPKKVQAVMGHSSIQVTYDIYGHLFPSPNEDKEAMAKLEIHLLGSPRKQHRCNKKA